MITGVNLICTGDTLSMESTATQKIKNSESAHQVTRWAVAPEFRKIQEKYRIPHGMFMYPYVYFYIMITCTKVYICFC